MRILKRCYAQCASLTIAVLLGVTGTTSVYCQETPNRWAYEFETQYKALANQLQPDGTRRYEVNIDAKLQRSSERRETRGSMRFDPRIAEHVDIAGFVRYPAWSVEPKEHDVRFIWEGTIGGRGVYSIHDIPPQHALGVEWFLIDRTPDDEYCHYHLVTRQPQGGRVFSSIDSVALGRKQPHK